jgi:PAS domain S-box-containing protein
MQRLSRGLERRLTVSRANWSNEFPGSIIVCDPQGLILEMNERAIMGYRIEGGRDLIGKNLLDCHPEAARAKLLELMRDHRKNVYTIEKNGIWKLIYQSPWFENGEYRGFVELSLEIPAEMPHFVRQG